MNHWRDKNQSQIILIENRGVGLKAPQKNRFIRYQFEKHSLAKDKNNSELLIQTTVSKAKDKKKDSINTSRQDLLKKVREISVGTAQDKVNKKKVRNIPNAPPSVYKILRDLKAIIDYLKSTVQYFNQIFQLSLSSWKKVMQQIDKKTLSFIKNNLQTMSQVKTTVQPLKHSQDFDKILTQSQPIKRRLHKKFTLTPIIQPMIDSQEDFGLQPIQIKQQQSVNNGRKCHTQRIEVKRKDSIDRRDSIQSSSKKGSDLKRMMQEQLKSIHNKLGFMKRLIS